MLAGWVFADLLLGMMVIFLVAAPGAAPFTDPAVAAAGTATAADSSRLQTATADAVRTTAAAAAQRSTAAAVSSATAAAAGPTATPTAVRLAVLETTSVDFTFDVDAALNGLDGQLLEALSVYRADQRRAGFVMVFSADSSRSQAVIGRLVSLLPEVFDRGAVLRPYIDLNLRNSERGRRSVTVEVFFFNE
jgi:hypothetical protein